MFKHLVAIAAASLFTFTACAEDKEAPKKEAMKTEGPVSVLMSTSKGDITIKLDHKKAPITVANFLTYVDEGHYDGTIFHRVIDGFMIQGGGFTGDAKKLVEKETKAPIKNESPVSSDNKRGSIAMARTNVLDSATAQFFINVTDNKMLNHPNNGGYATFGEVTKGMDVVDQIKAVKTGRASNGMGDVPTEPVVIKSVKRLK